MTKTLPLPTLPVGHSNMFNLSSKLTSEIFDGFCLIIGVLIFVTEVNAVIAANPCQAVTTATPCLTTAVYLENSPLDKFN